jgi:hypothetical protein
MVEGSFETSRISNAASHRKTREDLNPNTVVTLRSISFLATRPSASLSVKLVFRPRQWTFLLQVLNRLTFHGV